MEAVDGEGDGEREEAGPSGERPDEELPELEPFFSDDPEQEERDDKRPKMLPLHMKAASWKWTVFLEENQQTAIVPFW